MSAANRNATVAAPLIAEIGLTNYLRFCRDTSQSFEFAYIKIFGRRPRFLAEPMKNVPQRRAGEQQ